MFSYFVQEQQLGKLGGGGAGMTNRVISAMGLYQKCSPSNTWLIHDTTPSRVIVDMYNTKIKTGIRGGQTCINGGLYRIQWTIGPDSWVYCL